MFSLHSANSLSLLASTLLHENVSPTNGDIAQPINLSVEGDCIFAFPVTSANDEEPHAGLVLGLSTGWVGTASLILSESPRLLVDWVTNRLKQSLQLYLCGAQVDSK